MTDGNAGVKADARSNSQNIVVVLVIPHLIVIHIYVAVFDIIFSMKQSGAAKDTKIWDTCLQGIITEFQIDSLKREFICGELLSVFDIGG